MSDIHIYIEREQPVKVITLEPSGKRGPAGATGPAGPAGPNSVTSATTSDGTATISLATLTASGEIKTTGETAFLTTEGAEASIATRGEFASISTEGANAGIFTTGANASISTQGENALILTEGSNAPIRTLLSYIQTGSTFRLSNGTHATTLSHTPTGNRAIAFPDASGTVALTSQLPDLSTAVLKSAYTPAHSILAQQSGTGSPTAVTLGNNTILGRKSGGGSNIAGLSASDARTVMGLGTLATVDGGTGVATALAVNTGSAGAFVVKGGTATDMTLAGTTTESPHSIGNSGTAITLNLANGTFQGVTMTGNCTFTMPTATAGRSFTLRVSTGAGGFTGTFTGVKWPGNVAPVLTTTASRLDIIAFVADGTNWFGQIAQNYTP